MPLNGFLFAVICAPWPTSLHLFAKSILNLTLFFFALRLCDFEYSLKIHKIFLGFRRSFKGFNIFSVSRSVSNVGGKFKILTYAVSLLFVRHSL